MWFRSRTWTPKRIDLTAGGVAVSTRAVALRAQAAILAVSTAVRAGDAIRLPPGTESRREAAAGLPLGRNERVFLEVGRGAAFEPDSHAHGNLRDARSAAYSIRPNGRPIIEAFLGGEGVRILDEEGPAAGFAHATAELVALFGNDVASAIRPLAATSWRRMAPIGGAYSCALPGQSQARARLARPFEDRLFFAGEATHPFDFTIAQAPTTADNGPLTRPWRLFGAGISSGQSIPSVDEVLARLRECERPGRDLIPGGDSACAAGRADAPPRPGIGILGRGDLQGGVTVPSEDRTA